jgi:hypothetical protein
MDGERYVDAADRRVTGHERTTALAVVRTVVTAAGAGV